MISVGASCTNQTLSVSLSPRCRAISRAAAHMCASAMGCFSACIQGSSTAYADARASAFAVIYAYAGVWA